MKFVANAKFFHAVKRAKRQVAEKLEVESVELYVLNMSTGQSYIKFLGRDEAIAGLVLEPQEPEDLVDVLKDFMNNSDVTWSNSQAEASCNNDCNNCNCDDDDDDDDDYCEWCGDSHSYCDCEDGDGGYY